MFAKDRLALAKDRLGGRRSFVRTTRRRRSRRVVARLASPECAAVGPADADIWWRSMSGDVTETNDGLVVTVARSKTDQEGDGRQIGIPYGSNPATCPVRTFRAWLGASQIDSGPLFRPTDRHGHLGPERLSDRAVAIMVKRTALAAGLDPKLVAGHSLRSGKATSAARAGATEAQIMNQTGHKTLPVLRRYIRRGSLFNDNAAAKLGL